MIYLIGAGVVALLAMLVWMWAMTESLPVDEEDQP